MTYAALMPIADLIGFVRHISEQTGYPADELAREEFEDRLAKAGASLDALKTLVEENKRFSGTLTALASDAHEMKPEAVRTIARQALSQGSSR